MLYLYFCFCVCFPSLPHATAEQLFGERKYAKYYRHAKDRSKADLEEMIKRRTWHMCIRNISFTNVDEVWDFFVQFNVGWDWHLYRKTLIVTMGDGQDAGKRQKKHKWVSRGDRGVCYLTRVKKYVGKGQTARFDEHFEAYWHGSYLELFDKKLHVELWDWNEYRPNRFLAKNETSLINIATGKMQVSWDMRKDARVKGKRETIMLGKIEFQMILQERIHYVITPQNWAMKINPQLFNVARRKAERKVLNKRMRAERRDAGKKNEAKLAARRSRAGPGDNAVSAAQDADKPGEPRAREEDTEGGGEGALAPESVHGELTSKSRRMHPFVVWELHRGAKAYNSKLMYYASQLVPTGVLRSNMHALKSKACKITYHDTTEMVESDIRCSGVLNYTGTRMELENGMLCECPG